MITFLKTELAGIWEFLKRNANEVVIITAAVLIVHLFINIFFVVLVNFRYPVTG